MNGLVHVTSVRGKETEERVPVGKPEGKVIARHEFGNTASAVTG
jgi:hypothetical protein